jgi:hypothetical protein
MEAGGKRVARCGATRARTTFVGAIGVVAVLCGSLVPPARAQGVTTDCAAAAVACIASCAANRALGSKLDAMEQRKEAQRTANAERLQARRDAAGQRQCAASQARLEKARAQSSAMPPQHAERHQVRLQTMERAHAQRCSD